MNWIKEHERLIIIILVLSVLMFSFNKYINYESEKTKINQALISEEVKQLFDKVQADETANNQERKAFEEKVLSLESQNKSLISQIENDNIVLRQRQTVDNSLSLKDLSLRWENLVGSGITPNGSSVLVTSDAAHETVNQLESVPVMKDELTKDGQLIENKEQELEAENNFNLSLTKEIQDGKLLLDKKDKQCQADISALKAGDRKGKRNWFLRGVVVGGSIVTYIVLHY